MARQPPLQYRQLPPGGRPPRNGGVPRLLQRQQGWPEPRPLRGQRSVRSHQRPPGSSPFRQGGVRRLLQRLGLFGLPPAREGKQSPAEDERTSSVVGRSEADDADALRTSLADIVQDVGRKVAELERKTKYLEDQGNLPNAARSNDADPELGQVEEYERATSHGSTTQTTGKTASVLNREAGEAFYEIKVSMWDAGLLLFLNKNKPFDQAVLIFGILLNLGLQGLMFLVIVYNLLDNEFSRVTVQEMLRWRVEHGHSSDNFDPAEGRSLTKKLCEHDLWSYEGKEYEEMYAFLFRAIPGAVLSVLAIILWVLATVSEYRKCTSQIPSLLNLATVEYHVQCIKEEVGGKLVIIGISTVGRISAFLCLIAPRIVVALSLMLAGSKFLAQTVTLAEIVLNTVALAYVMDTDEHIADVVLTERLYHIVQNIQPLRCGRPTTSRARVRDVIRYVLIFTMIIFSIFYWVLRGVGEDLRLAELLGANVSIADFMSANLSNSTF